MSAAASHVGEILGAFPSIPVTDAHLAELYENPAIETIWVPTDRRRAVFVDGGVYEGDIYHFVIETDEQIVKSTFSPAIDPDGPRWERAKQISKVEVSNLSAYVGGVYRPLESAGGGV